MNLLVHLLPFWLWPEDNLRSRTTQTADTQENPLSSQIIRKCGPCEMEWVKGVPPPTPSFSPSLVCPKTSCSHEAAQQQGSIGGSDIMRPWDPERSCLPGQRNQEKGPLWSESVGGVPAIFLCLVSHCFTPRLVQQSESKGSQNSEKNPSFTARGLGTGGWRVWEKFQRGEN